VTKLRSEWVTGVDMSVSAGWAEVDNSVAGHGGTYLNRSSASNVVACSMNAKAGPAFPGSSDQMNIDVETELRWEQSRVKNKTRKRQRGI
jgi:hypothetical protein